MRSATERRRFSREGAFNRILDQQAVATPKYLTASSRIDIPLRIYRWTTRSAQTIVTAIQEAARRSGAHSTSRTKIHSRGLPRHLENQPEAAVSRGHSTPRWRQQAPCGPFSKVWHSSGGRIFTLVTRYARLSVKGLATLQRRAGWSSWDCPHRPRWIGQHQITTICCGPLGSDREFSESATPRVAEYHRLAHGA